MATSPSKRKATDQQNEKNTKPRTEVIEYMKLNIQSRGDQWVNVCDDGVWNFATGERELSFVPSDYSTVTNVDKHFVLKILLENGLLWKLDTKSLVMLMRTNKDIYNKVKQTYKVDVLLFFINGLHLFCKTTGK